MRGEYAGVGRRYRPRGGCCALLVVVLSLVTPVSVRRVISLRTSENNAGREVSFPTPPPQRLEAELTAVDRSQPRRPGLDSLPPPYSTSARAREELEELYISSCAWSRFRAGVLRVLRVRYTPLLA